MRVISRTAPHGMRSFRRRGPLEKASGMPNRTRARLIAGKRTSEIRVGAHPQVHVALGSAHLWTRVCPEANWRARLEAQSRRWAGWWRAGSGTHKGERRACVGRRCGRVCATLPLERRGRGDTAGEPNRRSMVSGADLNSLGVRLSPRPPSRPRPRRDSLFRCGSRELRPSAYLALSRRQRRPKAIIDGTSSTYARSLFQHRTQCGPLALPC
ncbi:hypothetical protein BC628DRAFT_995685 [Trametes gibbosa]|nr:hypothetical protein BC628DRAFT_995685 [Trametes gibbosa]